VLKVAVPALLQVPAKPPTAKVKVVLAGILVLIAAVTFLLASLVVKDRFVLVSVASSGSEPAVAVLTVKVPGLPLTANSLIADTA